MKKASGEIPGAFSFEPDLDCAAMRLLYFAGWRRLLVTGLCLVAWRALEQITVVGLSPSTMFFRLQTADSSTLINVIGNSVPLAGYSIAVMGAATSPTWRGPGGRSRSPLAFQARPAAAL